MFVVGIVEIEAVAVEESVGSSENFHHSKMAEIEKVVAFGELVGPSENCQQLLMAALDCSRLNKILIIKIIMHTLALIALVVRRKFPDIGKKRFAHQTPNCQGTSIWLQYRPGMCKIEECNLSERSSRAFCPDN